MKDKSITREKHETKNKKSILIYSIKSKQMNNIIAIII